MRIPVLMFGYDIILILLFLRTHQHNLLVRNLYFANWTVLFGWLSVQFSFTATGVEVFDTRKITSWTDESKHPTSEICARTHTHTHTHKRIHSLKPSGHYMYHQSDIHQCYVVLTQCIYVLWTDLRTKSDHIVLPDWLCKRQEVCLLRGTGCAVTETSEHGVSRTSRFYCTCVLVVSRNRSLSRTLEIHLGKGRRQTNKPCISLRAQRSQNHSESLRSMHCAVTRCWLLCVLRGAGMQSKGKVHPRTVHEALKGEYRYSSTLSLTSALDGGWWSTPQPGRFTPCERPGTHCTGGWVGPRAGLDGCGKSRPYRDSIPGPSNA